MCTIFSSFLIVPSFLAEDTDTLHRPKATLTLMALLQMCGRALP
jgi:hypothetical protein